ncbi:unnamed protein product [Paramecium pentaurelia]|uniref:Uncharacterized protein n=1 Tax=Paramecium pentaurelia TaxID=43138 RepID=A0A8S1UPM3_9CILI|nr:unnamed protein product [Paramecium pentaurelia]
MFYSQQPYIYFPFYQTQMCYPIYYCSIQPSPQQQPATQEKLLQQSDQCNYNPQSNHTYDIDQDKSFDSYVENDKPSFITNEKKQSSKSTKTFKALDTTNFHKNFAKAIVAYAIRQQFLIFRILGEQKGQEFLELLQSLKNKLSNLTHFAKHTSNSDFQKTFRILGMNFLKKESTQYIYNSKIQQKSSHLKHKKIIKKTLLRI